MKFSIVATFSGIPEQHGIDVDIGWVERECVQALGAEHVDTTEPGDCEYDYLADEGSDERWKTEAYDVTVSALVDRETFDSWCKALYLRARDEQTIGTLGGPLGLCIVPDLVFSLDEQQVIDCIRVTPVPTNTAGEPIPTMERIPEGEREEVAERTWDRLRSAVLKVYSEGI